MNRGAISGISQPSTVTNSLLDSISWKCPATPFFLLLFFAAVAVHSISGTGPYDFPGVGSRIEASRASLGSRGAGGLPACRHRPGRPPRRANDGLVGFPNPNSHGPPPKEKSERTAVDGGELRTRTIVETMLNSCLLVFGRGFTVSRVSERWCEMDFVRPQYDTFFSVYPRLGLRFAQSTDARKLFTDWSRRMVHCDEDDDVSYSRCAR